MWLAYTFDVADFTIIDAKDEIVEDGSERLEKIAKKLKLDYELLGFEQAAIIINRNLPNILTFSETPKIFQINQIKSKILKEKLKKEGIETLEPSLVTEPDWDKYGNCHNYDE